VTSAGKKGFVVTQGFGAGPKAYWEAAFAAVESYVAAKEHAAAAGVPTPSLMVALANEAGSPEMTVAFV
jgi:hypothetical protein